MKRMMKPVLLAIGLAGSAVPVAAQSDMKDVTVKVRMLILADGTVMECKLIRTSGRPKLDKAACRGALRNRNYKPSTDEAGNPIDSWRMEKIVYSVPR